MSRERNFTAIILKRQDYSETDQIVTLFTKEAGKVRAMVKSAKALTNKLQGALQPMFISEVTIAKSSGMGQVIRASVLDSALGVYSDSSKLSSWFIVAEMLIKTLPDEEPNDLLFKTTQQYLQFLGECHPNENQIVMLAMQFQLKALRDLGLGMQFPSDEELIHHRQFAFDSSEGGFISLAERLNTIQVDAELVNLLQKLDREQFQLVEVSEPTVGIARQILNNFITYQLDRELKSTR